MEWPPVRCGPVSEVSPRGKSWKQTEEGCAPQAHLHLGVWSGRGRKTGGEGSKARNEALWVKDPESHNQMRREAERRGRLPLSQPDPVTWRNAGGRGRVAPQLSALGKRAGRVILAVPQFPPRGARAGHLAENMGRLIWSELFL